MCVFEISPATRAESVVHGGARRDRPPGAPRQRGALEDVKKVFIGPAAPARSAVWARVLAGLWLS